MSDYILPILIICLFVYCKIKNENIYDNFVKGAKKSIDLVCNVFAYIVAVFILIELFNASGLSDYFCNLVAPVFNLIGVPEEVVPLIIIKPFSGSGTLSVLSDIYTKYGVDSYAARCATCILGSSETVFYVTSVYFASTSVKKTKYLLPLGLLCTLISSILSCLLCKIMY